MRIIPLWWSTGQVGWSDRVTRGRAQRVRRPRLRRHQPELTPEGAVAAATAPARAANPRPGPRRVGPGVVTGIRRTSAQVHGAAPAADDPGVHRRHVPHLLDGLLAARATPPRASAATGRARRPTSRSSRRSTTSTTRCWSSTASTWPASLQGDFGESYYGVAVSEELSERFAVTAKLGLMALGIEAVIGIFAGVLAALKRGGFLDNAVLISTLAVIALPDLRHRLGAAALPRHQARLVSR